MEFKQGQEEAVDWLASRTEAFLWLPVGFGKTVITLSALAKHREVYGPDRALVVSTKNIVEKTWGTEIEKFGFQFSYGHCVGRKPAAIHEQPDVLGVNFENLAWILDYFDEHGGMPDILVIDESSKMKDPGSFRTRKFIGQRRRNDPPGTERGYVHRFKRRWALSATPASEGYKNLWAQEACVSPRRRLGLNIGQFRRGYCYQDNERNYHVSEIGESLIEQAIDPITYNITLDEYDELPPPSVVRVSIPWTSEELDRYQEMEEYAVLALQEVEDHDLDDLDREEVVAANAGVLLNKLRQICSGFVYNDAGDPVWFEGDNPKIQNLEEILDRAGDSSLVVFTQFTATQDRLAEHFGSAVHLGLPDSLEDWDAGRGPRMLCLHPRSAGHGINLQYGSSQIVWYEYPWSKEDYDQGVGRIQRRGQPHPVTVHRFQRVASVEGDVWAKLQAKGMKLSQLLSRVGRRHELGFDRAVLEED